MLSGKEIEKQIKAGAIVINPFDAINLDPNSYCLHLADELMIYTEDVLECKRENKTKSFKIPKSGFVLQPGELYLARTQEYTETHGFVPILHGRLSLGMLGVTVHITAGFGDNGFCGTWTLEIFCIRPVRIYPGMRICHICYFPIEGSQEITYHGKYLGQRNITASQIHKDLWEKEHPCCPAMKF
jgi:dCTP deaminase